MLKCIQKAALKESLLIPPRLPTLSWATYFDHTTFRIQGLWYVFTFRSAAFSHTSSYLTDSGTYPLFGSGSTRLGARRQSSA